MSSKKFWLLVLGLLLVVGIWRYSRPVPEVMPNVSLAQAQTSQAISLPWPTYGQGALGAQGYGLLETHGEQKVVPMASITKVVTALAVLKQKPLAAAQQGPNITINSDDVAFYNYYYTNDGSVVKVTAGEQISQYQALQALLIPSANNMADSLVRWAFGSNDAYVDYANKMLADMGLGQTRVADASGFSVESTSTAADLVKLGLVAMDNPVIAELVSQATANLPVAGSVNNVNWLLGTDGVVGIKTGNTEQAGGCFLFAAKRTVVGQEITLIGALMQAPDRNTAIRDSRTLIKASDAGFELVKVAAKDQIVGTYKALWGASAEATAAQDLNILAWRGNQLNQNTKIENLKPGTKAGTNLGTIAVYEGQKTVTAPLTLKTKLPAPSIAWRILR